MRELVPACGARRLLEHVSGERLLEDVQEPLVGEVGRQSGELVERELPADRRRDGQGLVALR